MKRILNLYKNAYGGLSHAAWMLAFIMLVNRSGSMVLPFMSVYLKEELNFSISDAGILMAIYGLGAMAGSFLGGWLTDKFGHFRIQFWSLVLGGMLFFMVIYLHTFEGLAIGLFVLSIVSETLRPANISSISFYSKPENVTRAFSLNRMAINLGFSLGPAIGGILAAISYNWLFVTDGITCILAGFLFYTFFRTRRGHEPKKSEKPAAGTVQKPHKDFPFLVFSALVCIFAILFFQIFTTLPLYFRDVYHLSETTIGILLGLNGLFVFLVEMILVYLVGDKIRLSILIFWGLVLTGLGYVVLNIFTGLPILYTSIVILSLAEILAMPFMATLSVQRSTEHNRGAYMGFYAFAYATAFVLAPYLGTKIVDVYDFETLWWGAGVASVFTAIALYFMVRSMEKKPKAETD